MCSNAQWALNLCASLQSTILRICFFCAGEAGGDLSAALRRFLLALLQGQRDLGSPFLDVWIFTTSNLIADVDDDAKDTMAIAHMPLRSLSDVVELLLESVNKFVKEL